MMLLFHVFDWYSIIRELLKATMEPYSLMDKRDAGNPSVCRALLTHLPKEELFLGKAF
jgi:hypothetical protein